MNAIELNKAMNLQREIYSVHGLKNLSYNMKLWQISNKELRDKLWELMCKYEGEFFDPLNEMIEEFNRKWRNEYHESIATMEGRLGGYLCLNLYNKITITGTNGYWYDSEGLLYENDPSDTELKRDFRRLAENIRKYYLNWAEYELKLSNKQ